MSKRNDEQGADMWCWISPKRIDTVFKKQKALIAYTLINKYQNKMKQQTVYVPVNSKNKKKQLFVCEPDKYEYLPISQVKPFENVNILTDSELLELKKKWCSEAFEHTLKYAKDECWSREGMEYEMNETFTNKHKETYLNNLNL